MRHNMQTSQPFFYFLHKGEFIFNLLFLGIHSGTGKQTCLKVAQLPEIFMLLVVAHIDWTSLSLCQLGTDDTIISTSMAFSFVCKSAAVVRTGTSLLLTQSSLLWVAHCWPCQAAATWWERGMVCVCVVGDVWSYIPTVGHLLLLTNAFFVCLIQIQSQIMQSEVSNAASC